MLTVNGSRREVSALNHEAITIDDCLDMSEKKGQATVIVAGQVVGFEKEGGPYEDKKQS